MTFLISSKYILEVVKLYIFRNKIFDTLGDP
jgi:hypothetical protein